MDDRDMPTIPGELVSEEVGRYLKTRVSEILHLRNRNFPGSQPVSFTRNHLEQSLMNHDYLVCEKSDGLRVLLLTMVNPDSGEEGTFLITRENEYYMVPNFHFPRSKTNFDIPQDGTIIDGELILSKNPHTNVKELRYLIFDCLAMNMEAVTHKNLWKRLYHAQQEFHVPYMELRKAFPEQCSVFPFKLDFKNMTQPYKITKIFREMKNLTYVSDGLIFTCCETPYLQGTDNTLFKWKPAEENTIDFKLKLEFPVFVDESLPDSDPEKAYLDYDSKPLVKLCVWQGGEKEGDFIDGEYQTDFGNYKEWNELFLTEEEWKKLKEMGESYNGRIVEARRDEDGHWKMLRFRDDKSHGNHVTVVQKVLASIKDSVKKEDLMAKEEKIKQMWELREKRRKEEAIKRQNQPHQHKPDANSHHDHHEHHDHVQEKRKKELSDDDNDDFEDEIPTYERTPSPKYGENGSKKRKM